MGLVQSWRNLKDRFPGINHSRPAIELRNAVGIGAYNFIATKLAVKFLWGTRTIFEFNAEDVSRKAEHCRRRLLEIGVSPQDRIFKCGFYEGNQWIETMASLDEIVEEVHMTMARHYAHSMKCDSVSHWSETEQSKRKAEEHMVAAGLDPATNEAWQKVDIKDGIEEACHYVVCNIKFTMQAFLDRLEKSTDPSDYANIYVHTGQVFAEYLNNEQELKKAGFKTPDEVLEFLKCPVNHAEIERNLARYAAALDMVALNKVRIAIWNPDDSASLSDLKAFTENLQANGWDPDGAELWSIICGQIPELEDQANSWGEFLRDKDSGELIADTSEDPRPKYLM